MNHIGSDSIVERGAIVVNAFTGRISLSLAAVPLSIFTQGQARKRKYRVAVARRPLYDGDIVQEQIEKMLPYPDGAPSYFPLVKNMLATYRATHPFDTVPFLDFGQNVQTLTVWMSRYNKGFLTLTAVPQDHLTGARKRRYDVIYARKPISVGDVVDGSLDVKVLHADNESFVDLMSKMISAYAAAFPYDYTPFVDRVSPLGNF